MQVTGNNFIHLEHKILSIRLSANGFSFFVADPMQNSIVCYAERQLSSEYSYLVNLKQAFNEIDFLHVGSFEKVNVLLVNEQYTFIPLELFDENQKDIIFDYNISRFDNELIHQNVLKNNSCVVLFAVDNNICDFLKKRFPDMKLYSQASVLTEYFSLQSRSVRLKQMFAYLRSTCVDIFCFDRGAISLVNSYKCNSVTDFSYYLLLVWKQLGMSQLNDELYIVGNKGVKEELVEILSNFVKKLTVLSTSEPEITLQGNTEVIPYDIRLLLMKDKI